MLKPEDPDKTATHCKILNPVELKKKYRETLVIRRT